MAFHKDENGVALPDDFDPREIEWTYDISRLKEFPHFAEQLDALWHDIDNGTLDKTGAFYTLLKVTKDKYPKGSTRKPYKE